MSSQRRQRSAKGCEDSSRLSSPIIDRSHKLTVLVNLQRVYRAMYDYEAQDLDEVSFCDGDLIVNCTAIDEGWMTGLVQRTGRHGMLPANYVEPAQI